MHDRTLEPLRQQAPGRPAPGRVPAAGAPQAIRLPATRASRPPLRPDQVRALQRTVGNRAVTQLLPARAGRARPAAGTAVVQRYALGNLVNESNVLTHKQRKLYLALDSYAGEQSYVAGMVARAAALARTNPILARTLRRHRQDAQHEITELRRFVADIRADIFQVTDKIADPDTWLAIEMEADSAADHILDALADLQKSLNKAAPTRSFDNFMGDPSRLGDYATGDDPAHAIPIVWYKRKEDYEDIVLTRPDESQPGETRFEYPHGPLLDFKNERFNLNGAADDPFRVNQDVFHNQKNSNSRLREAKIMAALRAYGFNASGKQGDHIIDLGFSGRDADYNVWPLDSTINQRPITGWRKDYGINYRTRSGDGATATPASLVGKYFKIKDHLQPGDPSVPPEGKLPDEEAGLP